jgi:hypothetical protein
MPPRVGCRATATVLAGRGPFPGRMDGARSRRYWTGRYDTVRYGTVLRTYISFTVAPAFRRQAATFSPVFRIRAQQIGIRRSSAPDTVTGGMLHPIDVDVAHEGTRRPGTNNPSHAAYIRFHQGRGGTGLVLVGITPGLDIFARRRANGLGFLDRTTAWIPSHPW